MDELRHNFRSEELELQGNAVLSLDEPGALWLIERGRVAVFGARLGPDGPIGRRRFFFSCTPGEALFGVPEARIGATTVIAVALEPTTLRKMVGPLLESAGAADRSSAEWVERWIGHWHRSIDLQEIEQAQAAARTPFGGLPTFHAALLQAIERMEGQQDEHDRKRAQDRGRRALEMTEEAYEELTAVLAQDEQRIPQGTALFVAACAAAQANGIRLRRPGAWEQARAQDDPVEVIARASHIRVRRVILHDRWWEQDCGPLLAFVGEERMPLALLPRGPGRYEVFDPLTRDRTRVSPAVAARIEPEAYTFYRPLPDDAAKGIELMRFALRGRRGDLLLALVCGMAATVLGMFTPQATAMLVDHAIPDAERGLLIQLALGLAAAAVGVALFRLSQGIVMMRVETGADSATQAAVWDRLLNLQMAFFRQFSTGDLQSRVTAVSQIRAYLGGTTLRSLFSSVIMLLNLALLLYYSPPLTVVAVVTAAVSGVVTILSGTMILRCTRQILELSGHFFGLMVQLINGVAKLRVAAAEERAFARWARDYSRLLRLQLRERRINDNVQAINIGLSTLSTIALFAIASTLIEGPGGLSTGTFLAFNVAFGTFVGAVTTLSNTVTDVMGIAILRERARPILDAKPEVNEAKTDPGSLEGRIKLDNVVFGYAEDGPTILDGVTFDVAPGEFVALVGPSGSGKSTLFRLILGFESPRSGAVYYDSQDLTGLDVHAVRRQMGVVLQAGRINAGSLFDNIASGTRVSLNDAWDAARAVGFGEDIEAMPMGMHTVISEGGTNLSGGQRQRLLLTRALVHKPRVLLLDEATSALDNKTQAIVSQSLKALDVTRVVIAHRLSTIRDADRIHVLESGKIIQQGSFEQLAEQEGLFKRLMARQMT